MKKQLLLLLIFALPFTLLAQKPVPKGPLDGRVYETSVTKEGKKKPLSDEPDEFKFTAGKFKSRFFGEKYKYNKQVPYLITSVDSTNKEEMIYTWKAESVNDIKETVQWVGTITGENMEGTGELYDEKGKKMWSYTFTGKLKKKPEKK